METKCQKPENITMQEIAEFNEAVSLSDEILDLLHDKLADHTLDSIIYQTTFSLARALAIVANAAEQAANDNKGEIKEQCVRLVFQLMYNQQEEQS